MARPLLYQSNSFQAETAGPAAPLPGRDMASTIPLPSVRGVLNMAYIEAVSGVDSSMGRAPCSDTGVAGSIPALLAWLVKAIKKGRKTTREVPRCIWIVGGFKYTAPDLLRMITAD